MLSLILIRASIARWSHWQRRAGYVFAVTCQREECEPLARLFGSYHRANRTPRPAATWRNGPRLSHARYALCTPNRLASARTAIRTNARAAVSYHAWSPPMRRRARKFVSPNSGRCRRHRPHSPPTAWPSFETLAGFKGVLCRVGSRHGYASTLAAISASIDGQRVRTTMKQVGSAPGPETILGPCQSAHRRRQQAGASQPRQTKRPRFSLRVCVSLQRGA
ncbi:hypothetical protein GA0061098_104013 [Bradyrhizobium shewense]|uniref:Uncharacterized protein n=1 Tax=Bradyrhizobium shewense TaxID=1761772 RepID=A0A1C3XSY4_9BRAD|nr:hypothetical protein GA0061098_104013 [Bradyrhizobium shewense]